MIIGDTFRQVTLLKPGGTPEAEFFVPYDKVKSAEY